MRLSVDQKLVGGGRIIAGDADAVAATVDGAFGAAIGPAAGQAWPMQVEAIEAQAQAKLVFNNAVQQPGGGASSKCFGAVTGIGGVQVAEPGVGLPDGDLMAGSRWMVGVSRHDAAHDVPGAVAITNGTKGGSGKGGTVAVDAAIFAKARDFNRQPANLRVPAGEGRCQQARSNGLAKPAMAAWHNSWRCASPQPARSAQVCVLR